MSRSVSAPSSVTNTSPCWNGLIVPGSTLRYGSNFCSWTRRPRAFSRRPSDAATMPFPSAETTPPVTKMYLGARALTGFQGSRRCGCVFSILGGGLEQRVEAAEGAVRVAAVEPDQPRAGDGQLDLGAVRLDGADADLGVDPVAGELERDPLERVDREHEQHPARLRPAQVRRTVRAHHLPARPRCEAAAIGLHAGDSGPPVGQGVRLGEEAPDVAARGEQCAAGGVSRHAQRTVARNAWPPSIRSNSARR